VVSADPIAVESIFEALGSSRFELATFAELWPPAFEVWIPALSFFPFVARMPACT
jgi:hypothetical protein